MYFPLSFAAGVLAFACGMSVAALVCFIVSSVKKSKIPSHKISFFIISFALMIASVVFLIVYVPGEIAKDVLKLSFIQIIICALLFILGGLFFYFTKITSIVFLTLYAVFGIAVGISLSVSYDHRKNYDIAINSHEAEHEVVLECYELKSFVFLPFPRIWYKAPYFPSSDNGAQAKNHDDKNFLVEFILKTSVTQSKNLMLELPEQKFYPAVYRINIKTTGTNVFAKVNSVY